LNNMGGATLAGFFVYNSTFDSLYLFNEVAQFTNEGWAPFENGQSIVMSFNECTWRNNTGVGTNLIRIAGKSGAGVDITFRNCVFEDNNNIQSMIYTDYETVITSLTVSENIVRRNVMSSLTPEGTSFFFFRGEATNAVIHSNRFEGNDMRNSGQCFFLSNGQAGSVLIEDNHFNNNKGGGATVGGSLGQLNMTENTFYNGTLPALSIDGPWNVVLIDRMTCDRFDTKFARKYGGCLSVSTKQNINILNVFNSNFSRSTAQEGGLAFISVYKLGVLKMNNIIFTNGSASEGGGMFIYSRNPQSNMTITNCSFFRNSAISAGGLQLAGIAYGARLQSINFERNTALNSGGALLFSATARRYDVHQCNFTDNSGRLVGGVISLTRESDINLFYLTEARIKNGTSILGGCLASGGSVRMTIANSTIA